MRKLHQSDFLEKQDGARVSLSGSVFSCPCCYAQNSGSLLHGFGKFDLVSCKSCGVLHLAPLPESEALQALYNNNYYKDPHEAHGYLDYAEDSVAIQKTYSRRLEKSFRYIPSDIAVNNVHEVGCALGIGLEVAARFFKCTVSGSDISEEAVSLCRTKGYTCSISDNLGRTVLPAGPKVDLLYFFDVIEHLTDVPRFLEWADSVLSDNGIMIFTTPDMDSWLNRILKHRSPSIKIPQHVIYFSTKTLVQTLKSRFSLLHTLSDWQYVTPYAILRRLQHILGTSLGAKTSYFKNSHILVPNGMRVYVFQKNGR